MAFYPIFRDIHGSMLPKFALHIVLLLVLTGGVSAGELKVDINRDVKNYDAVTEFGYVKWSQDSTGGAASGTTAVSKSFLTAEGEFVTVSFAQTPTSQSRGGAGLLSNWYQIGAEGTAKLVSDGITVDPSLLATGGEIQMTITGLSAGPHTLLTFHNHWDNIGPGKLGPMDIYLNGVQVVDNLQPTIRVPDNSYAPVAYLEFEVAGPSDVTTIRFSSETNTPSNVLIKNVLINGFEIDTPNSTRIASIPIPADGEEHADADAGSLTLNWSKPPGFVPTSHDVYFGTNPAAVKGATRASPEFKGNQTAYGYLAAIPSRKLNYYWRIDEFDSQGNPSKGTVWSFRPRSLAFPGAEGYGRFARGGRGGVVVEVTNTADSGPGSLRDALTGDYGPRTVVFNVSGLITLESDLIINSSAPYLTLAGQTAPGKGICVRKHQLGMSGGKDVIIRHVRSRPGNLSGETMNGSGMAGSDHCIMDHVSISWGIDEELSTRTARNVTFQRSLISEALNISGHQNYPSGTKHGYAASVGGNVASLHHNLLAHCEGRNWSMAGGLDGSGSYAGRLDIFNNVVYNWGHRTTDGGAHEVNFVNNYYKPGAASAFFYALNAQYGGFPGTQQYYFAGNLMPGYFGLQNQEAGRIRSTENGGTLPTDYESWVASPFFPSFATIHTASNAYKQVLSDAGCNQPLIDEHDARVVMETLNGTCTYTGSISGVPGLPDSQTDVGGWEDYPEIVRPPDWDTDHDGLPNWWETLKGLNPNSALGDFSDSNADPDGDEYTNLEDYLNWMAGLHFDCTNGASIEVDLTRFTRGYTNAGPVYSVYGATNGTVGLVSGHIAVFTPSVSSNALGGFTFSVVDAAGDSMVRNVGLRLLSTSTPPQLGIRTASGGLFLELTGQAGSEVRIEASAGPGSGWSEWTNVTATGVLQLMPLNAMSGEETLFFRAATQ